MVFCNTGRSGLALQLGGGARYPTFINIGNGSGAGAVTATSLVNELRRTAFTSTDVTVQKEVTWTADWDSVTMSGTVLKEMGIVASGTGAADNLYGIEAFANNAITFDGSNELEIQFTCTIQ